MNTLKSLLLASALLLAPAAFSQSAEATATVSEELKPEYPGGEQALLQRVADVVEYPAEAIANKSEGLVVVKFIVSPEGEVVSPEVVTGVTPSLDRAALEAVGKLGKFNPATVNGTPVSSFYTLPIKFRFQKDEFDESKAPDVMINGYKAPYSALLELKEEDIATISKVKPSMRHPNGLIIITTK